MHVAQILHDTAVIPGLHFNAVQAHDNILRIESIADVILSTHAAF